MDIYYNIHSIRFFDEVFDKNREPEPEPDDTWTDDEIYEWWSKPRSEVLCDKDVETFEEAVKVLRKECANPNTDRVVLGYNEYSFCENCYFEGDRLWNEGNYIPEHSYHITDVDKFLEDKAGHKLSHYKFPDEDDTKAILADNIPDDEYDENCYSDEGLPF